MTAKDVFDAVKAGDQVAMEIAEEFGRYLGYALANIAALDVYKRQVRIDGIGIYPEQISGWSCRTELW